MDLIKKFQLMYAPYRPLFRIIEESASAGYTIGKEAALFQAETGIAGQTGFGGGAYSPVLIEQEYDMMSITPSSRII